MEFNEEKAKKIIDKFSLSEKTLCVWKTRKKIPDKYSDSSFEKRKNIERKDVQSYNRILKILEHKGINKNVIAEISGFDNQKLVDIRRKEYKLSAKEFKALKSALNQLKIDIASCFNKKTEAERLRALKQLFERPELRLKPIFHDFDKKEYDNISRFRRKLTDEPGDMEKIKDYMLTFAMQINI